MSANPGDAVSRDGWTGWLIVGLSGAVLGLLVAWTPLFAIALVLGVIVAWIVWTRPVIAICVYAVLMASGVWYEWYPLLPLPGGYAVYPHEPLLFLLVIRAISVARREIVEHPRLRHVVVSGAIALGSVLFAAAVALLGGQDLGFIVNGVRAYMLVALIPAIAVLVRTESDRALILRVVTFIIAVVAVLMMIQIAVGFSVEVFPGARLDAGFEESPNLVRSHPPATVLATVLSSAIISTWLASSERNRLSRRARLTMTLGGGAVLLLSFWRSYWLGALGGAAFTMVRNAKETRARVLIAVGAGLTAAVVLLGPVLFPGGISTGVAALDVAAARLMNVFTGDVTSSGTITDRLYEFQVARTALAASPVMGVGPGGSYGAFKTVSRDGVSYSVSRGSAHNSYLSLYLYLGLPGLLTFVLLLAVLFFAGFAQMPAANGPATWALSSGLPGGVITVLIASMLSNWLGNISQLSAVAIAFGLMASTVRDVQS